MFLFTANRLALTKPASMDLQTIGISLKISPVEHINIC